jgi:hypothetical protein
MLRPFFSRFAGGNTDEPLSRRPDALSPCRRRIGASRFAARAGVYETIDSSSIGNPWQPRSVIPGFVPIDVDENDA